MPEYREPSCLRDVAAFHRLFKAPVVVSPAIPDAKRCALRVELLQEELNELKEAISQNDLVEVADALADIQSLPGPFTSSGSAQGSPTCLLRFRDQT